MRWRAERPTLFRDRGRWRDPCVIGVAKGSRPRARSRAFTLGREFRTHPGSIASLARGAGLGQADAMTPSHNDRDSSDRRVHPGSRSDHRCSCGDERGRRAAYTRVGVVVTMPEGAPSERSRPAFSPGVHSPADGAWVSRLRVALSIQPQDDLADLLEHPFGIPRPIVRLPQQSERRDDGGTEEYPGDPDHLAFPLLI